MKLPRMFWLLTVAGGLGFACAVPAGTLSGSADVDPGSVQAGGGEAGVDGGAASPPPGGSLPDEQFPSALLAPYSGPPNTEYDDTFVGYLQLKGRVAQTFADPNLGGGTEAYFGSRIALLGGADFKTTFAEARVASPDFLVALDGIAKEACGRAAANKTGPFAGTDPGAVKPGGEGAILTRLYQKILLRDPTATELADATALSVTLAPLSASPADAWAGVCEALVRHPDFLFTLPPSASTLTGAARERMQLVKLAMDLVARTPLATELEALAGKSVEEKVAFFMATPEFRDFYFHRARVRTESTGSDEADEPARLWTYLMISGAPMQEVLTADYSVDPSFAKVPRGPEHGKSGVLTMPGFVKTKPGLPHFNYAARVMTDYMGQLFEITPAILAARVNATASSTVQPGTLCISCHGILTPLAHQRMRWGDDGVYRGSDDGGAPIDDSDQNLVPEYPFKGAGMESFAAAAVRKEKFIRQTFQAQFLFLLGRQMRFDQDERGVYLALWRAAFARKGDLREVVKIIASTVPGYLGN